MRTLILLPANNIPSRYIRVYIIPVCLYKTPRIVWDATAPKLKIREEKQQRNDVVFRVWSWVYVVIPCAVSTLNSSDKRRVSEGDHSGSKVYITGGGICRRPLDKK